MKERRTLLRRGLVAALRAAGHGRLVAAEAPTKPASREGPLGVAVVALLFWFPAATVSERAEFPYWAWPVVAAALVVILALSANVIRPNWLVVVALIVAAPICFILQTADPRFVYSHVLPALAVAGAWALLRGVGVKRSRDAVSVVASTAAAAPLLLPLALVALTFPALSPDLWQLAVDLDELDFALLAALTVLPLFLLTVRHLAAGLPRTLAVRARQLQLSGEGTQVTKESLAAQLSSDANRLLTPTCDAEVTDAWSNADGAYGALIAAAEQRTFAIMIMQRLGLAVLGVFAILSVWLYALVAVVVDPRVASGWAHVAVPLRSTFFSFAGALPGGVYLRVVALISLLATALFLSFILLEERFSDAMTGGLLDRAIDNLLALAVPYLALVEARIDHGETTGEGLDIEALFSSEEET